MAYTHYLFDLDNTLLDFDRSSKEAFSEVVETLGMSYDDRMFTQYCEINYKWWKLLEEGAIVPREVQQGRFRDFLAMYGRGEDPMEINNRYLHLLSQKVHWIEGAREVLDALKERGASLTLITNGLKSVQRPRLERSGLYEYFELVVISEEIGHAKPQKAYFDHTLQQLNHPGPQNVLVVGDNAGSDVLGGQRAGLKTCWYNRKKKPRPEHVAPPTYEIADLRRLLQLT